MEQKQKTQGNDGLIMKKDAGIHPVVSEPILELFRVTVIAIAKAPLPRHRNVL